tara:strand:- start:164 stop:967 length:804 start_codon:yes stop_codon:yes gene_type:complete
MFDNLRDRVSRAYEQFDKNYGKGFLPGGAAPILNDTELGGYLLAAQEAIPAVATGALRLGDRYDRSIDPRMKSGLIDAYKTAKLRGAPRVRYQDYNTETVGGQAAKLTFGDVSYDDFNVDPDGNLIGLRPHAYDTNKTVDELTEEINNGGKPYKIMERELARVQDGGTVYHELDLNDPEVFTKPTVVPSNMLRGRRRIRKAGEVFTKPTADITVNNTAVPGPATDYAVQAGDTLTAIAADLGTTVDELVRRNNIENTDLIQIGQIIR